MNDDNASERAVVLMNEVLDVLQRAENAPASPVTAFLTAKKRRALRRDAARLRRGQVEPRYKNLHTAEELAAVYERTIRRDEMFEQSVRDFRRIARDLDRLLKQNPPELQQAMEAFVREALRLAEEQGPGSEAARRYRNVVRLAWFGYRRRRRQRHPAPRRIQLTPDPSVEARYEATAMELLDSPPSADEAVITIPPEGQDSGRGRIFLRIGIGKASWIGSFERGHKAVSTLAMLPDRKHLFVSAEGAGYILDAQSKTLIETIGTEVVAVMRNEPFTLFVVDHNGMSLEAFGTTGRLWKTNAISSGGFRQMALTPDALIGEACHPTHPGWVAFSVNLATGEVWVGEPSTFGL